MFFLLDLGSAGEEKLSGYLFLLDLGSAGEELFTDLLLQSISCLLFLFSVLTVREIFVLVFRVDG